MKNLEIGLAVVIGAVFGAAIGWWVLLPGIDEHSAIIRRISSLESRIEALEVLKIDNTRPPPASPCVIYLRPGNFDGTVVSRIIESIECGPRTVVGSGGGEGR